MSEPFPLFFITDFDVSSGVTQEQALQGTPVVYRSVYIDGLLHERLPASILPLLTGRTPLLNIDDDAGIRQVLYRSFVREQDLPVVRAALEALPQQPPQQQGH
jgi:hypothetical protein